MLKLMPGFIGQCMENLLMGQEFWLNSLDQEDTGIEVSVDEETLSLMYRGILMQEGTYSSRFIKSKLPSR